MVNLIVNYFLMDDCGCCSTSCPIGEICGSDENHYQCECAPGFTGADCTTGNMFPLCNHLL